MSGKCDVDIEYELQDQEVMDLLEEMRLKNKASGVAPMDVQCPRCWKHQCADQHCDVCENTNRMPVPFSEVWCTVDGD